MLDKIDQDVYELKIEGGLEGMACKNSFFSKNGRKFEHVKEFFIAHYSKDTKQIQLHSYVELFNEEKDYFPYYSLLGNLKRDADGLICDHFTECCTIIEKLDANGSPVANGLVFELCLSKVLEEKFKNQPNLLQLAQHLRSNALKGLDEEIIEKEKKLANKLIALREGRVLAEKCFGAPRSNQIENMETK